MAHYDALMVCGQYEYSTVEVRCIETSVLRVLILFCYGFLRAGDLLRKINVKKIFHENFILGE